MMMGLITYWDGLESFDQVMEAKRLRANPSRAEELLWRALECGKMLYRFRRQRIVLGEIVDFYCPKLGLAIFLQSTSQNPKNVARQAGALRGHGLTVVQFRAADVLQARGQVKSVVAGEIFRLARERNVAPSERSRCLGL